MQQKNTLIDIGANLAHHRFHADLDAVIDRARQAGVEHIIVTGTSERASRDAHALTQNYAGYLSSTAGVHPHEAKNWNAGCAKTIEQLAGRQGVVAIGECGLDYNRMFSTEAQQLLCFEAQLQLAVRVQKPVFLHEREAHDAFFALLKQYRSQLKGAVVHCFTGNTAEIREYLDLDCHIGVTGWVCDERRGDDLRQALKFLPKEKLMIETDAPFLLPRNLPVKPQEGRNEPMYLPVVLEAVASILGISATALAQQVRLNTGQFFNLPLAA
ncbi:TatD family hydrolase [Undibacterium sp. CY18W]|uniref:TatD family hydrolase n=1 Tax=Undibacterium hunanense TaxID=2762292 RepID=A0ABR6ZLI9_9BURK|nr:TatD family hydrolase [Undibacterium hunanense]MBC3916659.1 TatD family hydrolase [Undibacterium hunanense]